MPARGAGAACTAPVCWARRRQIPRCSTVRVQLRPGRRFVPGSVKGRCAESTEEQQKARRCLGCARHSWDCCKRDGYQRRQEQTLCLAQCRETHPPCSWVMLSPASGKGLKGLKLQQPRPAEGLAGTGWREPLARQASPRRPRDTQPFSGGQNSNGFQVHAFDRCAQNISAG